MLWTIAKVGIALVIGVPLLIIGLSMALGLMGALVGLAVLVLRVALIGLLVYGAFRLAMNLMFGGSKPKKAKPAPLPPPVDPYLEIAKRELDRDLGVR
jgi:hypothetical protein